MVPVNYVMSPIEWKINPGDTTRIGIYVRSTKEINKETEKLHISVLNAKDIVYQSLSISNKYGWGRLDFMVNTGTVTMNIFRLVEQIILEAIQNQAHGYFGLIGIVNYVDPFPSPLIVSSITYLYENCRTSEVENKIKLKGCAQILYSRQLRDQLKNIYQET